MPNPGQITVKISAVLDDFNRAFMEANGKVTGFGKEMDMVNLRLSKVSDNLKGTGQKLSMFLTLPILGAGAAAVKAAADYETLETSLKTILGSSEAASNAMKWIADFAAKTPYQMDTVAASFAKLSAAGFDATKYIGVLGDTASAMGKSLDQSVDMFTDAATGEFERLKEFGIKARTEGDKVTFTWQQNGQAMSKTVLKSSTDITTGLTGILSKFKGGMEEQSKTLNGSLSNLADNATAFGRVIGQSLAPYVQSVADGISSLAQSFSGLDEGTKNVIISTGLFLALLGPVLMIIGKMIAAYKTLVIVKAAATAAFAGEALAAGTSGAALVTHTIITKAATAAAWALNAALSVNPLVLFLGGVVALGAGLFTLGKYMQSNATATKGSAEAAAEAARRNKELSDAIKGVGESSEEARKSVDGYVQSLSGMSAQDQMKKIRDAISELENRTRMLSSHDEQRIKNLDRIRELSKELQRLEKESVQTKKQAAQQANDEWLRQQKSAREKWGKYNEEFGLNEVQQAELWYSREYTALADANARKLISDEMYVQAAANLEEELAKKKENIQKQSRDKMISDTFSGLSAIRGQIGELGNLFSMYYSNRSAEVDNWQTKQMGSISTTYDAEKANIEATITDKTQRDAALKALDEKRARDEKSINEKAAKDKRKLQRDAAIKEKQIATFETLLGIPKAAFDAYQSVVKIPFIGPALAVIAASAATAFGITKLALIQAQPLPALAEGGYFSGPALIGEAGREFAFPIDGPQGQAAMSILADRLLDSLQAKINKIVPPVDRSATIEKSSSSMFGKMTVVIQDAGRTLGEYIGEVVEDGSRRGNFVVYARGKA